MVKDIVLLLVALALAMLTNVGVCIYGWGLQPVSWFWIIGMSLFGNCVVPILVKITAQK